MSKLFELQAKVIAGLENKSTPDEFLGEHHFDVYVRAYAARLEDSLVEDFPLTFEEIDNKEKVIRDYLSTHPSKSWTLAELGSDFPEFLALNLPQRKDLHRLAKMEWAHWLAFSIGQTPQFELKAASEDFILAVNPSLQVVDQTLVFSFNGSTHELEIDSKWISLLEKSQRGLTFQAISSETEISLEEVIPQISQWSQCGVILGFR